MRLIYLLTTVCLSISTTVKSQYLEFQRVINVPEVKATILLDRANRWAVATYHDYQKVLQFKDSTNLAINATIVTTLTTGKGGGFKVAHKTYAYTIQIEARPGRTRVTINNFREVLDGGFGNVKPSRDEAMDEVLADEKRSDRAKKTDLGTITREYEQIDREMNRIMTSLEGQVKKPGINEEW